MTIVLYNTLTRKKEALKLRGKSVSMYSCGPTVYNYPHIGNYRAYIVSDLLKRYLRYRGSKVKHVMNITDVDDKTIRESQKEGVSLTAFTRRYEKAFFEDLDALAILPADTFPRATEHIAEMVALIEKLLKKKKAYTAADGSVYYNIGAFARYGELAHLNLKKLKAGASGRVNSDEYSRESVQDFALWKAYTPDDGDVFWKTSIGKGRPGWHIECSAMSMKYLGETFDIHSGGIDLVFPHHQNEIAQSEGVTGKRFVRHWVHNEWLLVEGQKMSKSLGNFYTLRDILAKGFDANAVRYLLLATHYRQQLNFTFDGLKAAASAIERLQECIAKLKEQNGKNEPETELLVSKARLRFTEAMGDDLNISSALAAVFDYVRDINRKMELGIGRKNAEEALEFLEDVNEVLGVMRFTEDSLTPDQRALLDKREQLRTQKKFKEADAVRATLLKQGIQLDDTSSGARWKKLK